MSAVYRVRQFIQATSAWIRPAEVEVRYIDRQGDAQQLTATGLLATALQHEIDHLNGKLFVDYLSQLKRQRIRKKLEKQRRHGDVETPPERHGETVI